MYIPKQFEEVNIDVMHELIRAHPLATLVTHSASGLNANHIPLHLTGSPAPFGTLRGHIARANPLCGEIAGGVEALAVFHGPEAYVTPSWYPTKAETGKVVPTWNYAVVHACGALRTIDDAAWLRAQLEALTRQSESELPEPWSVSDAPAEYVAQLSDAIVGIEMVIAKLLGKWKVSQNQPIKNQIGVVAGLRTRENSAAEAMAVLMKARQDNAR